MPSRIEAWPLGPGVRVLKGHPCGLAALEKPVGVRAHPNRSGADARALLSAPYDRGDESYHLAEGGGEIHLLNRLDAPTSGIVLVASERTVAERVRRLFAERLVEKVYFAWVWGDMRGLKATWRDRYHTDRQGGVLRARCGGGSIALTEARCVQVVRSPVAASLLELRPKTGRTHQLRIQCAERSMPIVGDGTYGDFRLNRQFARASGEKRLFLHAARIALRDAGLTFAAAAPLPDSFKQCFGWAGHAGLPPEIR